MKQVIKVTVNGEYYEKEVVVHKSLLDFLRDDLNLTGTKKGCDNGDCGSCTVLLNGKPINSCMMLAVEADGCEILTIEGIAGGKELHPIQKAFVESGAIQCGYCTPGMVMAAKALLDENPDPSETEIREAIVGHLCRCTGYDQIVRAIKKAASYLNKK
ncbi:(2Fe-2S)-binding protein [Desulfallas sp. Bu1-1]|uniref:(2Fe-2S)-binding protein n=1 Tax=Desulfallas sp. Bu1-1 TaxID=2787620 RepID=UPI00189FF790|nr:(2Fe-2S)-binding protein [Desulfallas sp. Bu1-1]MBF7084466.1 (2Fe-2S)-binding protein [Desulfallas sp. Bu1-1]